MKNTTRLTFVIASLITMTFYASADAKEGLRSIRHSNILVDDGLQVFTFDQRVNWDDPTDTRTFSQRYFINSKYASGPSAPVFLYICGEYSCGPAFINQAALDYAKLFKGYLVSLEHRYYGESQPFSELTTENLKYLSVDFALKDLAAFEKFMIAGGLIGKWIALGSSYAGSLSAYYRSRYPDLVVGALASSAAIQAVKNFDVYDRFVAQVLGTLCQKNAKSVILQIEAARNNPQELSNLKHLFQADAIVNFEDFVDMVAGVAAGEVQYGTPAHFCEAVDGTNALSGFTQVAVADNSGDAVDNSSQGAESLNPAGTDDGGRSWLYQCCTEFGWWQDGYPVQSESVNSQFVNLDYRESLCERVFGIHDAPAVDEHNRLFFAPLQNASTSNILFTNGSKDPWSLVSISKENGAAVNPNTYYYMIEGASHREDIAAASDSDSDAVKTARAIFKGLVRKWLE